MTTQWADNVAQSFEACVDVYDQYSDIQRRIAQILANELPILERPNVLEIGCGTGALTRHLLDIYKDGKFYITDVSPRMLAFARKRFRAAPDMRWGLMDGENPISDQRYDLIVSNMVVQWFENPDEAFGKLLRLLKPGGVLFYTAPAPTCFQEWKSVLSELSLPTGVLNFEALPGAFREEKMVVSYGSVFNFLQSLKGSGAHMPRLEYKTLNYADMKRACHEFDARFKGHVTWRILFGCLNA